MPATQQELEQLKQDKEFIVSTVAEWVKDVYPNRTNEPEKCVRDLGYIYDAFVNTVEYIDINYAHDIAAKFWHKGVMQLVEPEVEVHTYAHTSELIKLRHPTLERFAISFFRELTNGLSNKPKFKVGNESDPELTNKIHNLAKNRHNWKPLTGDKPTPEHLELILEAAAGMTPALSNEYNYRVDEVPDYLKEELFTDLIQWSDAAEESGNTLYARDQNDQLKAPTLLCWCLRYNPENDSHYQFCGDMTDRDPNLINIGLSVWHTCLTAESLGYKTSFCQVTGWKRDTAKEILGLTTDEVQSEHLTKRNGQCDFMPMIFLAIGTEGRTNTNTRAFKSEDIINKMQFREERLVSNND